MALFKKEEKLTRQEKIEAKKEAYQEKVVQKEDADTKKFLEKYNLNSIDKKDLDTLRRINAKLKGSEMSRAGAALSLKGGEAASLSFQSVLVDQNWMIIKQLSDLNNKLDKLIEEK